MTRACVVCGQYVPGSQDIKHEPVPVHARCHHGRATERRFGVSRPDPTVMADGGSYADEIEAYLTNRLRTASDETVIVRPCHIREATGLSHGRYAYGVGQLRERDDADVVLERWGRDQGGAWRVRWARAPAPVPDGGPAFKRASDLREGGEGT